MLRGHGIVPDQNPVNGLVVFVHDYPLEATTCGGTFDIYWVVWVIECLEGIGFDLEGVVGGFASKDVVREQLE